MLGPKQISSGGACEAFVADAVNQIPSGSNVKLATLADAIPAHIPGRYFVQGGGGADLMTIAAPNPGEAFTGGDDGKEIEIISQQASAHTITFTGSTAQDGAGHVLTALFAAQLGGSIRIMANNGKWIIRALQGVTMTA